MFGLHNAFTFEFSRADGQPGKVNTLITPIWVTLPVASSDEAKGVQLIQYSALWDTGASSSVITKKVVDDLNLKSIGMVEVTHADGKSSRNTYLIGMELPNKIGIGSVQVVEGILTGFDVLVGMDIITLGDFAITNKDNKTKMSFRVPSFKSIDFVPESNQHNFIMTQGKRKDREAYIKQHK